MKPHTRLVHHFILIGTVGACAAAGNAKAWGTKL